MDNKTCKRGFELATIVFARISMFKNEARVAKEKGNEATKREKVAIEREIVARAMEEESRGGKK